MGMNPSGRPGGMGGGGGVGRSGWDRGPGMGPGGGGMLGPGGHQRPSLLASAPGHRGGVGPMGPMGGGMGRPPRDDRDLRRDRDLSDRDLRRDRDPVDRDLRFDRDPMRARGFGSVGNLTEPAAMDREESEMGEVPPPLSTMGGGNAGGAGRRSGWDAGPGSGWDKPHAEPVRTPMLPGGEEGELPSPLGAHSASLNFDAKSGPSAAAGATPDSYGLPRHMSAPASSLLSVPSIGSVDNAGGDEANVGGSAPRKRKLGWGQGLARSKSTAGTPIATAGTPATAAARAPAAEPGETPTVVAECEAGQAPPALSWGAKAAPASTPAATIAAKPAPLDAAQLDGQPPLPAGSPPPGTAMGIPPSNGLAAAAAAAARGAAATPPPPLYQPMGAPGDGGNKMDLERPGSRGFGPAAAFGVMSSEPDGGTPYATDTPASHARATPPLDPVARAAAAAAAAAEQAARKEMLESIERTKAEILEKMEKTDAAIASLEREIAESEDKGENDREQVEAQRTHEDARVRRELEGARSKVAAAERAAARAAATAEDREEEADELRIQAGLDVNDEEAEADGAENGVEKTAEAAAQAVQNMLAGREPRLKLVKRIHDHNKTLAQKSHNGIKTTCGLPLAHEVARVTVEEIAERNAAYENDPRRDGVKAAVKAILVARRAAVADKELDLALSYIKQREEWRVRMVRAARQKLEKELSLQSAGKGGKTPTPGSRSSSRLRPNMAGVVRSDYEEMQVLQELQAQERLKTLVKLPPMVLDPEAKRLAIFRSRNALVEDPYGEMEAAKLVRPWTDAEKKIFHEKFSSYGKNFKRIATFIDGRTTADCVVYYYQRQKTEDGFRGRRKAQAKKKKAYADARRMTGGAWNGSGNAAAQAAKAKAAREAELRAEEEARQERAAIAAAARAEKRKKQKEARAKKKEEEEQEEDENVEDSLPLASKKGGGNKKGEQGGVSRSASKDKSLGAEGGSTGGGGVGGGWDEKEKTLFVEALKAHGKDFKAIAAAVQTKSQAAVKGFFAKHKKAMGLEKMVADHAAAKAKDEEKAAKAGGAKKAKAKAGAGDKAAGDKPKAVDAKTEKKVAASGVAPPSMSDANASAAAAAAAAAVEAYQRTLLASPFASNLFGVAPLGGGLPEMLQALMQVGGGSSDVPPSQGSPAAIMQLLSQMFAGGGVPSVTGVPGVSGVPGMDHIAAAAAANFQQQMATMSALSSVAGFSAPGSAPSAGPAGVAMPPGLSGLKVEPNLPGVPPAGVSMPPGSDGWGAAAAAALNRSATPPNVAGPFGGSGGAAAVVLPGGVVGVKRKAEDAAGGGEAGAKSGSDGSGAKVAKTEGSEGR